MIPYAIHQDFSMINRGTPWNLEFACMQHLCYCILTWQCVSYSSSVNLAIIKLSPTTLELVFNLCNSVLPTCCTLAFFDLVSGGGQVITHFCVDRPIFGEDFHDFASPHQHCPICLLINVIHKMDAAAKWHFVFSQSSRDVQLCKLKLWIIN